MQIEKNKDIYEDLAPSNDVDISVYEKPLKKAIDRDHIHNVALAGGYGSGKSSIIKTFEKKYDKKYKFLNISLADFENDKSKDKIDIERSILQKIFYTVKSDDIPYSRFKRIRDLTKEEIISYSKYSVAWLFFLYITVYNDKLPEYLWFMKFDLMYVISFIFVFIGLIKVFPFFIKAISRFDLSNIKFNDGKVALDLGENDDSSILNKNIDEILYFFKATKYNVVVFEDLDRYNNSIEIFTKLREINIILNNSDDISRKITFLYAIKDDNFKSENRTKFFEKIIPVIPIIDYSNSSEKLREFFKKYKKIKGECSTTPDENFIDNISLHISNMRLLQNIYNEFVIYKDSVNNEILENNNLLALLVYKNLCPEDFSKLPKRDGVFYNILLKKDEIVKNEIVKLKLEIEKLDKEIKELTKEKLNDENEMKSLFYVLLLKKYNLNEHIYNGYQTIELKLYLSDENIFNVIKGSNTHTDYGNSGRRIDFKNIKDEYGLTYDKRIQRLKNKTNPKLDSLRTELNEKRDTLESIQGMNLKKIIDAQKLDISETLKEVIQKLYPQDKEGKAHPINKLIPFFEFVISTGTVDETYHYYISKFHEESLTKEDRDFLINFQGNRERLDYSYSLRNIDRLLTYLDDEQFKKEKILNFDLIEHLFLKRKDKKIDIILKQIKKSENIDFVHKYHESDNMYAPLFITKLLEKISWFWDRVEEQHYTIEKQDIYLKYILKFMCSNSIDHFNNKEQLFKYISSKEDFILLTSEIDTTCLKNIIKKNKIVFLTVLNHKDEHKELFEYIYKNNHYKLSYEIVKDNLSYFDIDLSKFNTSHFTTIFKSECKELKEYVLNSIEEYFQNVVLSKKLCVYEDIDILIDLSKNENLLPESKQNLFSLNKTIFTYEDYIEIPIELYLYIFENNLTLEIDWKAIVYYLQNKESVDKDIVLNFLNKYCEELINPKLDDSNIDMVIQYILNDKIEDTKFRKYIQFLNSLYNDTVYNRLNGISFVEDEELEYFNIEIFNLNKISYLIEKELVVYNIDRYEYLKVKFNTESLHIKFLIHNNDTNIVNENYPMTLKDIEFLIKQKLDNEKVSNIINNGQVLINENDKVNELVEKLAFKEIQVNEHLILDMFKHMKEKSKELKIEFLNQQFSNISDEIIPQILESIGEKYLEAIKEDGDWSKLEKNDFNIELEKNLISRGYFKTNQEE